MYNEARGDLPVLAHGAAEMFLEAYGKVGLRDEARSVGDFLKGEPRFSQQTADIVHAEIFDVFPDALAENLPRTDFKRLRPVNGRNVS